MVGNEGAITFLILATIFVWGACVLGLFFWVYADAARRGMETPICWAMFALATGPWGLFAYFASRPPLYDCPECNQRCLTATTPYCPRCGASVSQARFSA